MKQKFNEVEKQIDVNFSVSGVLRSEMARYKVMADGSTDSINQEAYLLAFKGLENTLSELRDIRSTLYSELFDLEEVVFKEYVGEIKKSMELVDKDVLKEAISKSKYYNTHAFKRVIRDFKENHKNDGFIRQITEPTLNYMFRQLVSENI